MANAKVNQLPDAISDLLRNAERFELVSLDPQTFPDGLPKDLDGWGILGSTIIDSAAARTEIVSALEAGIADERNSPHACFMPRHGIRISRGQESVELVICFECSRVYVYSTRKCLASVLVSWSPEPVFDKWLSEGSAERSFCVFIANGQLIR